MSAGCRTSLKDRAAAVFRKGGTAAFLTGVFVAVFAADAVERVTHRPAVEKTVDWIIRFERAFRS